MLADVFKPNKKAPFIGTTANFFRFFRIMCVCVCVCARAHTHAHTHTRSRDSSVSVVIRLRTGRPKNHASVPGREDIYFPQNIKTICNAHPISYLVGTVDPIPGVVKPFTYM